MKKGRLFLLDLHGLAYRAYFAIKPLSTSRGEVTNAIYGLTRMLLKLLKEEAPDFIVGVLDSKIPTFRHNLYPEYKIQRVKAPPDFHDQLPPIIEIVNALGIRTISLDGYEADDLIGTLARRLEETVDEVVIVSADKDMCQLVDEKIRVMNTRKGLSDVVLYGPREVEEHFGVPPERMVDLLGIMGDASDNIPGVKGFGQKKAQGLIKRFGTIENILSNIDRIENRKDREALTASKEILSLGKELVKIKTDSPIKMGLEECRRRPPDIEGLRRLFLRFEFRSLLDLLPQEGGGVREENVKRVEGGELDEILEDLLGRPSIAIDLEVCGPNPHTSQILEIFFGTEDGANYRIPLVGSPESVLKRLTPLLEEERIEKVGYNMKDLVILLNRWGIHLEGVGFDLMIASFLVNPSLRNPRIEDIVEEYLGQNIRGAPPGARVRCFFRLKERLTRDLERMGLLRLFNEVEMRLIGPLAEMEIAGIRVDPHYLKTLSERFENELKGLEEKVWELGGVKFNLNSPKQLSHVLFEKLSLPVIKRTKTGFSTDEEVLLELTSYSEIAERILEYRELSKLKGTYVDALPRMIDQRTGRIHTTYSQTTTSTGRLASSNPNLQNIPIRTELGRRIRRAFIPEDGWSFLSGDYSQVELRILAHISEDPVLMDAFLAGKDIHAETASAIFGVEEGEVTSQMRRYAKVINFGVIYGMSPFGLARELGVSREEAASFIDDYFKRFKGVKEYIDRVIEEAKERGFVTTLWGRCRWVKEINSRNKSLREMAERIAINTPIQGSSADLIKVAMLRIHDEFKRRGLTSRMILQVHDELLFEVKGGEEEEVREVVLQEMKGVGTGLKVPLEVSIKTGRDWEELD
jgi:DNA polymerase-1